MAWLYLFLAGLFEVGWTVGLKYSEGLTRFWPTVLMSLSMVISLVLMAVALREIPVGTGYAVWTGIGAVGSALVGIFIFGEPRTAVRLACIALILAGVVGLKLSAADSQS